MAGLGWAGLAGLTGLAILKKYKIPVDRAGWAGLGWAGLG